jgi:phage shock protein E
VLTLLAFVPTLRFMRLDIRSWLIIAAMAALSVSGCIQTRLQRIPADAVVLDVRSRTEFGMGHLACASSLPWYAADDPEVSADAAPDKTRPLVLYCLSGHRSATAKERLEKMGYRQVIDGGSMMSLQHVIERYDRTSGCGQIVPVAR